MPTLTFTTEIAASQEALFAFHDGTEALTKITPPGTRVRLIDAPAKLTQGVVFTLVVSQPPVFVPLRWRCEFLIWEPPLRFVDRQVPGSGRFEALDAKRSQLTDTITYTPPFGPLGKLADALFIRKQLTEMFAYRHRVTKSALEGV
jgi:ligand-binding SRPBCC domain-containing protein